MGESTGTVQVKVTNQGKTNVSPQQVTELATTRITSKDPAMTATFAQVGTPDAEGGVSQAVESETIKALTAAPTAPTPAPGDPTETPTATPEPTTGATDGPTPNEGTASKSARQWDTCGTLLGAVMLVSALR